MIGDSQMSRPFSRKGQNRTGKLSSYHSTCVICRMLESILRDRILTDLQEHNLIRSSQHGFYPHRSCLTNLLEFFELITQLIDEGHCVDVMFYDFSKPFDIVPRVLLLLKVRAHGITSTVVKWIEKW